MYKNHRFLEVSLFLSLTICYAFFAFSISAQKTSEIKLEETILIDEFGESNSEMETVRMEHFRFILNENPSAKGYIITYRDKELPIGFPTRYNAKLQSFLALHLGVSSERLTILDGGLNENRKTQLWLAPAGKKPPINISTNDGNIFKTILFDRFNYPNLFDDRTCCAIDSFTEQTKKALLDELAKKIIEKPEIKAYLIFYGQYCTNCSSSAIYSRSGKYLGDKPDIYLDSLKVINNILRKEKKYLVNHHNISASKIITVNGGYRRWQTLELWLVPKDGEVPKPEPESFPKKRCR